MIFSEQYSKMQIQYASAAESIASLASKLPIGGVGIYAYQSNAMPADYPQKMLDVGCTFNPIVTIMRGETNTSFIVRSPVNTSGTPVAINGYSNSGSLHYIFWGDIY